MTIPNGFGQINWFFAGSGLPTGAQVTLGFANGDDGGPANQAEYFWDSWRDNVLPLQCAEVSLVGCLVKHGPDATGPSAKYEASEAGGGGALGSPASTSLLVQKRTNAGGRAGKGRMYVPGLLDGQVTSAGVVLNSVVEDYQDAFIALVARLIAIDCTPVVLHGAGSPLGAPSSVTSLSVQGVVANQRLRQRR